MVHPSSCALLIALAFAGCVRPYEVEVGGVALVEEAPPRSYFDGPWPRESLSAEWMDYLLAPVALYPDPLLAQLLPASTYPVEIVRAKRLIDKQATFDEIDATDLDISIKALTRYPEVITLMDEHIEWTERVGQAFLDQQEEVMRAVQRLRVKAMSVGNLYANEQQSVFYETEYVRIVPITEYVYVPYYDSSVVYTSVCSPFTHTPYVTFTTGCAVGAWLNYDCDWRARRICRPRNWTWHDYCRRDRDRAEHQPRAAEHNGTRDARLVRSAPDARSPDEQWTRDAKKPAAPGGRPAQRVRGNAPPTPPPPPVELTAPHKPAPDDTPVTVTPVAPTQPDRAAQPPRPASPPPPPPQAEPRRDQPRAPGPATRAPGAEGNKRRAAGSSPSRLRDNAVVEKPAVTPSKPAKPVPLITPTPIAKPAPLLKPPEANTTPKKPSVDDAKPRPPHSTDDRPLAEPKRTPPPRVKTNTPPPPPPPPRQREVRSEPPPPQRDTPKAAPPVVRTPPPPAAVAPSKPKTESSPPARPQKSEQREQPTKSKSDEGEKGKDRNSKRS